MAGKIDRWLAGFAALRVVFPLGCALMIVSSAGCSIPLGGEEGPAGPAAPDPGGTAPPGADDLGEPPAEEPPPPPPDLGDCGGTGLLEGQWWSSPPFSGVADLADSAGRPFWEMDYEMVDYSTVVLPVSGSLPSGSDKAFRVEIDLPAVPEAVYVTPQSDDGLWLWVNGQLAGHWGGEWQEEGCVNDQAGCLISMAVEPIEVTAKLSVGRNVIAARVSNAVDTAYFDLVLGCVR